MGVYSLTVQEAGSLQSRCLPGWFLPEAPREDLSPALPASEGFRQPRLTKASLRSLPHLHGFLRVSPSSELPSVPL